MGEAPLGRGQLNSANLADANFETPAPVLGGHKFRSLAAGFGNTIGFLAAAAQPGRPAPRPPPPKPPPQRSPPPPPLPPPPQQSPPPPPPPRPLPPPPPSPPPPQSPPPPSLLSPAAILVQPNPPVLVTTPAANPLLSPTPGAGLPQQLAPWQTTPGSVFSPSLPAPTGGTLPGTPGLAAPSPLGPAAPTPAILSTSPGPQDPTPTPDADLPPASPSPAMLFGTPGAPPLAPALVGVPPSGAPDAPPPAYLPASPSPSLASLGAAPLPAPAAGPAPGLALAPTPALSRALAAAPGGALEPTPEAPSADTSSSSASAGAIAGGVVGGVRKWTALGGGIGLAAGLPACTECTCRVNPPRAPARLLPPVRCSRTGGGCSPRGGVAKEPAASHTRAVSGLTAETCCQLSVVASEGGDWAAAAAPASRVHAAVCAMRGRVLRHQYLVRHSRDITHIVHLDHATIHLSTWHARKPTAGKGKLLR